MKKIIMSVLTVAFAISLSACNTDQTPVSDSGVRKVSVKVSVGSNGMTTEQTNVKKRLEEDNKPGAIKHLYLISAYSGQTIFYSTVKGKVTSSSKRLTNPDTYADLRPDTSLSSYVKTHRIQDDGTYGSSFPYIYWWDTKGVYHQHYITGGQIVHVSSQPIAVKSVIINMESVN